MFVFRWLTRDCFWAGQGLEASVIRSEIRSTAELNCALPLFLHPSHQRDTAHRPIGTGRLRARRRFGYWGEQIGHLRDRPRPIKSTSPASIASFMALLLRKPPVTMTGILATLRISAANSMKKASRFMVLSARPSSPSSLNVRPKTFGCSTEESSKRSNALLFSHPTTCIASALVKPPFIKSDELSLRPMGKPGPTAARMAVIVSRRKRARFSSEPPPAVSPSVGAGAQELI